MTRRLSRKRRRTAFLEAAGQFYDQLETWYDEHPQASFGEIEAELRKRRRELMGTGIEVLVNGRDAGNLLEAPRCSQCGGRLEFEGYRNWRVHGLEGDVVLERAYYVCPDCRGETLFPPRSETEVARRPLE